MLPFLSVPELVDNELDEGKPPVLLSDLIAFQLPSAYAARTIRW